MIKVLIVDDSPTIRSLLSETLAADAEIQVIGWAENGQQGLARANELRPDLITMDVVMPDMDGLEATRQIMAGFPTPILIVTSHADSTEMNIVYEALKAGALDVIAKPRALDLDEDAHWRTELIEKVKTFSKIQPKPIKTGDPENDLSS